MSLNEKQKFAFKKIKQFLLQKSEKIFYLMGSAGTGKTYLMSVIVRDLLLKNKLEYVYICTPTHKALNVIESYMKMSIDNDILSKINFMTIHKLLEFKPIIITENGSKMFKSCKESKYFKQMGNKLIVIDECSMISREMTVELNKYLGLYPIKIIYMGDKNQLPPIGEKKSPVFDMPKNYIFDITLDQIMRTNSNDIKDVCNIIKNWNKKSSISKSLVSIHSQKNPNKSFKLYHKRDNYLDTTWFKVFVDKINKGNVPIILTWKNATSNIYNTIVRKYMHNTEDLNNYKINDCLMFNNYYACDKENMFYTSDMVKVIEIVQSKDILYNWKDLIIKSPATTIQKEFNVLIRKLSKMDNKYQIDTLTIEKIYSDICSVDQISRHQIQTINRCDLKKYKNLLNLVKEHVEFFFRRYGSEALTNKLWEIYHENLVDPYAELSFGYSITVHKAQGSTFKIVFVDVQDINDNPNINELKKALYTAASRASEELGFMI